MAVDHTQVRFSVRATVHRMDPQLTAQPGEVRVVSGGGPGPRAASHLRWDLDVV